MNTASRNVVIASILGSVVTFGATASARPVVDSDKPVTIGAKFAAPDPGLRASLLKDAVPQSQSPANGREEVIDLGILDDAVEPHPEYAIVKRAYPQAKVFAPIAADSFIPGAATVESPTDVLRPFAASDFSASAASRVGIGRTATCGSGTPITTYSKTWELSDDFGNSKFGAGYEASFTLASVASPTPNMDKLSGEGLVGGAATIFGLSKDLARVSAKAALQGSNGTSSISVKVLGTDLYSKSVAGNLTESKNFSKTFFSKSQLIWLGPVPVTFKATANGAVGYNYAATYVAPNVNLTAKPYAKAYGTATASIDAVVASAGVTGTLTFFEAAVPGVAKLGIQPTYITYDIDVDLVLKSLSGKIQGWAKVWYLFGSKKWTTTLASWNGISATYPIVDVAGCLPLKY